MPSPRSATWTFWKSKDNVVVLKGRFGAGGRPEWLRSTSISSPTKSKAAVISSYVRFLNAIDFPLQIVVQSRKLNIDNYLDKAAGD
jgi:hypothetical protein